MTHKTISYERLRANIDAMIHESRFADSEIAVEALEVLKLWAIDEVDAWGNSK